MTDRTYSLPVCEPSCDLSTWPERNLVRGYCPRCTRTADTEQTVRMLKARQAIKARTDNREWNEEPYA